MMQESVDMELVRMVYTTELTRIRYLLRAYLRTRLAKIEQFVMHILDNQGEEHPLGAGGSSPAPSLSRRRPRAAAPPTLPSLRSAGVPGSRAS